MKEIKSLRFLLIICLLQSLVNASGELQTRIGKGMYINKESNAGVMYGLLTFITDFIMDFITDFYLVKVSYKVHNKVSN